MKRLSKNIFSLTLLSGFVIPIISMASCTKTDNKNNDQDSKKDINVEFSKDENYEITGPTTISRSNINDYIANIKCNSNYILYDEDVVITVGANELEKGDGYKLEDIGNQQYKLVIPAKNITSDIKISIKVTEKKEVKVTYSAIGEGIKKLLGEENATNFVDYCLTVDYDHVSYDLENHNIHVLIGDKEIKDEAFYIQKDSNSCKVIIKRKYITNDIKIELSVKKIAYEYSINYDSKAVVLSLKENKGVVRTTSEFDFNITVIDKYEIDKINVKINNEEAEAGKQYQLLVDNQIYTFKFDKQFITGNIDINISTKLTSYNVGINLETNDKYLVEYDKKVELGQDCVIRISAKSGSFRQCIIATLTINDNKIEKGEVPNYCSVAMSEDGNKVQITISGKLIDGDVHLDVILPIT